MSKKVFNIFLWLSFCQPLTKKQDPDPCQWCGSGSVPKCHRSKTLVFRLSAPYDFRFGHTGRLYDYSSHDDYSRRYMPLYVPIPLGSATTWCSSLPPFLLLLSVSSFLLFVLRSMTPPYLSSTPSLTHLS